MAFQVPEMDGLVAAVSVRSFGDAVVWAGVWALFAGAAALGWRRRWLRHVAGSAGTRPTRGTTQDD